jgi:very-short-patch-repair endonuclease
MTTEDQFKKQRHYTYKQPKLILIATEYRKRLQDYKTMSERHIDILLKDLGVVYEEQKIILSLGKFWIADFYLPEANLIIELDGNQHYTHAGLIKDEDRDNQLKELGFTKTLRLPNKSAMELDQNTLKLTLEDWGILL